MADGSHSFNFPNPQISCLRPGEIVVDLFAGGGGASEALKQALGGHLALACKDYRVAKIGVLSLLIASQASESQLRLSGDRVGHELNDVLMQRFNPAFESVEIQLDFLMINHRLSDRLLACCCTTFNSIEGDQKEKQIPLLNLIKFAIGRPGNIGGECIHTNIVEIAEWWIGNPPTFSGRQKWS
ncbi:hypothetical protein [Xanthomonas phaseoli]